MSENQHRGPEAPAASARVCQPCRTPRESIEWCDVWVAGADRPAARRALLIGDSIARSYHPVVQEQLGTAVACARLATSRCVCDPAFARELALVLDDYEYTVIHVNNGLHGWGYSEDEYATGLRRLFDALRRRCPDSTLIWASTTPVWQADEPTRLAPQTERVRERNRLAADICREYGMTVNDLFALTVDRPDCFAPDGVHFNKDGQTLLGAAVARHILSAT